MILGYSRFPEHKGDNKGKAILAHDPSAILVREKQADYAADRQPALGEALKQLGKGDALAVCELSDLASSLRQLCSRVEHLAAKGIALVVVSCNIDSRRKSDARFSDMLTSIAAFDESVRRTRRLNGIEKAKRAGRYKGRAPTVTQAQVEALLQQGYSKRRAADELGVSYRTILRRTSAGKT